MARSKRRPSKKRKKKASKKKLPAASELSPLDERFDLLEDGQCEADLYRDNLELYEQTKGPSVDPLDQIDGIGYDVKEFHQQYPHLAEELNNSDLIYPIDEVRWNEEECVNSEITPPQEPTVESLLRRSRTPKEATEIIKYLEKRGEISSTDAKKLLKILKARGLKAFK
ncbi:MAG: DUF2095 family protein [Candidatus Helarchaeota archaeon]